jgi:membrane carboxypeptidase/penicillin-binding protein PbpC
MIVSPRHGAKYEIGTLEEEEIIFELSYGSFVKKDEINWFLDDKRLDCNQICSWKPTLGKHKLYAEINSESGKIKTSEVVFEVIGYKDGW